MKGESQIIERLNEALFLELGAVNQYWLHYRLLEDWGYLKLAKKEREESIEEMHHADKIIARIIFLREGDTTQMGIVWNLRLPRIIAAAVLGGGLALSGFLMQTGCLSRPCLLPKTPSQRVE